MKEQYYSILEVLQKNLSYDVDEEIRKYVAHSPNTLGRVLGIDNAKSFQVLDSRVKEVYAQFGQQINALVFDIIIECKLATDCEAYNAIAMLDLNLRFILDLTCPGGRVWPPRIVPAKDELHSRGGILLNEYFQPVLLTNEDLDRFAEMMLAVYCKKALRIPTVIRGTDLARWMGLKIRYVTFALEKDVKARTYFDVTREALLDQDGKEYYEAINPGTILINESRLRSEEDQNTTIIHECVHVFKDYYFFMLQRMVGAKVELYTSRRTGSPGCAPSMEGD